MHEGNEDRGADDRPENREGAPLDVDHQKFGQTQIACDEGAEKGADEANGDRDEDAATRAAADGTTNRATNASDDEQDDETGERDCHTGQRCKD